MNLRCSAPTAPDQDLSGSTVATLNVRRARGRALGFLSQYGYQPVYPRWQRAMHLGMALPLLLLSLPIQALIALALWLTQGWPVVYRGERLGQYGRTFTMYKFRTLLPHAPDVTADRVLPDDSQLETPLGKLLRESRLDELPQLFNVVRGDMNLVGPRPERPVMAAQSAGLLPGYWQRFNVKPGLVGYTQAVMTHGTPRTLRHRLELALSRRTGRPKDELKLLTATALGVLRTLALQLLRRLPIPVRQRCLHWLGRELMVHLYLTRAADEPVGRILYLDGRHCIVTTTTVLPPGPLRFWLRRAPTRRRRARLVACTGRVRDAGTACAVAPAAYCYRLDYEPVSALQHYLLERYFLSKSVLA